MQFKRVLPISNNPVGRKKSPYQNRTPAATQKQHVREFEGSGLRQVEFCEQHNIPYKTFTNWLQRYRSDQTFRNQISHTQEHIIVAAAEDNINKRQLATTIECTLPNGLNITLHLITLTDLTDIIEALSTCKLN